MDATIFILLIFMGILATAKLVFAVFTAACTPFTGGALFTTTHTSKIQKILDSIPMKSVDTLYDVGCGDARFLVAAWKRYRVKTIGYEINPWAYLLARIRVWCSGTRAVIYYKDFWRANLGDADIVFCYLFPDVMARLRDKLTHEARVGTRVISCNFEVPGWQPDRILRVNHRIHKDPIYIYTLLGKT